ncbi:hypothetical protein ACWDWV_37460, partial [Streptosporangium sandarakinum]
SPDGPVPGGSTSGGPEGGPYGGSPASDTRRLRWTRRAPKPTGPTTAIVRHGDHPADKTEKHTKPLTNPHG